MLCTRANQERYCKVVINVLHFKVQHFPVLYFPYRIFQWFWSCILSHVAHVGPVFFPVLDFQLRIFSADDDAYDTIWDTIILYCCALKMTGSQYWRMQGLGRQCAPPNVRHIFVLQKTDFVTNWPTPQVLIMQNSFISLTPWPGALLLSPAGGSVPRFALGALRVAARLSPWIRLCGLPHVTKKQLKD